jgi:hypothetical protein
VPILKSETPLHDYGYLAIENNFNIIPIKYASKQPSIPKWVDFKTRNQHLLSWTKNGKANDGIGILTAHNPCVDLDILDEDIAANMMEWVTEAFGKTIIKVGQKPKMGLIYRTDTPFDKITSPIYIDDEGRKNQIEILGQGQQTVTVGIHPGTEKPYRFMNQMTIANTKSEELPLLTEADAHAIIEAFTQMVPASWTVKGSGSTSPDSTDEEELEFHNSIIPVCDINLEEAVYYLSQVPASSGDYAFWFRIGAAIYHQYSGSEEGFQLWLDWSQADIEGFLGQTEKKLRIKWKTFDYRKSTKRPVTFASIIQMVNKGAIDDVEPDIMDRYLKQFALLACDRVVDLTASARSQKDWKGLSFKGMLYKYPKETYRPVGSKVDRPLIEKWLMNENKQYADGFDYAIGEDKIFNMDGGDWVNLYIPPVFNVTKDTDLLKPLFQHIDLLIPNDEDNKLFYQWMAHRVQFPKDRIKFTPLHISPKHGTGRGFIADFLANMVGINNLQTAKMKELAGEGQGAFNTFLNSAITVIHEVRESDKKFQISDKIRDTLDADHLKVTAKGQTGVMKKISCSFLMFSNHYDAVVMEDNDRRIWLIQGGNSVQSEKYYINLYNLLKNDTFLMQAYNYLKNMDISDFNRGMRAPNYSGLKQVLISNSESNEDVVIKALLEDKPFKVATRAQILEWAEMAFPEDPMDGRAIKKILDNEGCAKLGRTRWNGNTNAVPIVLFGNTNLNNPQIKEELDRTAMHLFKMASGEIVENTDDLI